jgi:hypothetical protein
VKRLSNINIRWSSRFAYIIGLIATDGYLSKDKRHITFTSQDKILVILFKNILGLKNKIGLKSSGSSSKKCPHIQFGDINFYQWLLKIGLTSKKSKTISKLKIPQKYFFDFLRGCFDGDGSCYAYWDKRWKSSFMFYSTFASGSLPFLEWLRKNIKNLAKIKGHIKTSRRSWQLCYAKTESKILFKKIYYNKNMPFLKRKYIKLKNFINTDNKNK